MCVSKHFDKELLAGSSKISKVCRKYPELSVFFREKPEKIKPDFQIVCYAKPGDILDPFHLKLVHFTDSYWWQEYVLTSRFSTCMLSRM
jgi:hypothetical protein